MVVLCVVLYSNQQAATASDHRAVAVIALDAIRSPSKFDDLFGLLASVSLVI